uniref:2-oxoisovalerate dehydrogenase subunit alpha n=1 Tax=Parascaris univalens TaxID=6257 RepID=A0A915BXL2_PARUN
MRSVGMLSCLTRVCLPSCVAMAHTSLITATTFYTTVEADVFRLHQFTEKYLHQRKVEFTEKMNFVKPSNMPAMPIYRVTDSNGKFIDPIQDPNLDKDFALKVYHKMLLVEEMDKVLFESQRQGRISFYLTNTGEEVNVFGHLYIYIGDQQVGIIAIFILADSYKHRPRSLALP